MVLKGGIEWQQVGVWIYAVAIRIFLYIWGIEEEVEAKIKVEIGTGDRRPEQGVHDKVQI